MANWTLTKGLANLRRQVDEAFPDRDKTSDGTIGDAAHQTHPSGHNPDDTPGSMPAWDRDSDSMPEVRAWDMDSDLNMDGITAQDLIDHLRSNVPNLFLVVRYMIYNRKMYHAPSYTPESYDGAPHTEHIHFEGAWTDQSDNNSSFNFELETLVGISDNDIERIVDGLLNKVVAFPYDEVHPTRKIVDIVRYTCSRDVIEQQLEPRFTDLENRVTEVHDLVNTIINDLIPPK